MEICKFKIGDQIRFVDKRDCSGCYTCEGIIQSIEFDEENDDFKIDVQITKAKKSACKKVGDVLICHAEKWKLIKPKEALTYKQALQILNKKEK